MVPVHAILNGAAGDLSRMLTAIETAAHVRNPFLIWNSRARGDAEKGGCAAGLDDLEAGLEAPFGLTMAMGWRVIFGTGEAGSRRGSACEKMR